MPVKHVSSSSQHNNTDKILEKSGESHRVEDRALERLGRLLSASSNLFNRSQPNEGNIGKNVDGHANNDRNNGNNSDDVISTSDTSSHLWQGVGGIDNSNESELSIYQNKGVGYDESIMTSSELLGTYWKI